VLSWIFLLFAVVHLVIWIWGWRAWAQHGRPVSLLLVVIGGTLLWYDNFRIGIGHFLGPGALLESLSRPAFIWHWTMLPLLVIAAGSVARLADLKWARNRIVMGAYCVLAVFLTALDLPKVMNFDLYVACLDDTVRYTTRVSAGQLCSPTDPVVSSGPGAAMVAIITNIVVLLTGIALWIQRGWKWLALGSGAMFVAAGGFGTSTYALPISNFGEICITLGFIATCIHFARRARAAPAASGTLRQPA
jgi:hypothetical protein